MAGLLTCAVWGIYHTGYTHGSAEASARQAEAIDSTVLAVQPKLDALGEKFERFNTSTGDYLNRVLDNAAGKVKGGLFCAGASVGDGAPCISRAELEYLRQSIEQAKQQIGALQQTIKILTKPEGV